MLSNRQLIKSFIKWVAYVVISFMALQWAFYALSAKNNIAVSLGVGVICAVVMLWIIIAHTLYLKYLFKKQNERIHKLIIKNKEIDK